MRYMLLVFSDCLMIVIIKVLLELLELLIGMKFCFVWYCDDDD